jgi:hypothetical protein
MAKCPECGEEIGWLVLVHNVVDAVGLDLDGETIVYGRVGEDYDDKKLGLSCPLCANVVANSLEEVKMFLRPQKDLDLEKRR